MKTVKLSTIIAIFLIVASCGSQYHMMTEINRDGSCIREIRTEADTFLFETDSSWEMTSWEKEPGSIYKKTITKIRKKFASVADISSGLSCDENSRPLAAPEESLEKKFRWFYTHYIFKTVYRNISEKIPVPVDGYMTKEKRELWFQGKTNAYREMTGLWLKEELDNIENKFILWYARNMYEASYDAILAFDETDGENPFSAGLSTARDTIFRIMAGSQLQNWGIMENNFNIGDIYSRLDTHFKTTYFSRLYRENREQIDLLDKQKGEYLEKLIGLYENTIDYGLIMPGRLLYSNAPVNRQDTLVWIVDALRITADDYELIAESRVIHIWMIVLSVFLAMIAVFCLVRAGVKR